MTSFEQYRYLLFSIAYRMTGSVMDAEDLVQDAFLRWQEIPAGEVQNPQAYLTTIITRLSIDYLRSARVQREQYIGPWMPEPYLMNPENKNTLRGRGDPLVLAESISMAFLVLLERLSPVERAVYLLREVFDYSYREIAEIVDHSEANCRQMVSRARKRLRAGRPRFEVATKQHQALANRFIQAVSTGDMDGLMTMLDQDVVSWSDGGGQVSAARRPVEGSDRVARLLTGIARQATGEIATRYAVVNNQPGILVYEDQALIIVMVLDVVGQTITGIRNIVNPKKLRPIAASTTDNL